jgi:hypothetical protein
VDHRRSGWRSGYRRWRVAGTDCRQQHEKDIHRGYPP